MEQHYDAIVIGAGNGGMTGALTLCKAGRKTLLLEQHNITGGCGSSYVRGRFEFETGLHQLYGIGDTCPGVRGPLRRVFEELGVFDKIEFVPQHEAFRIAFRGMGEIVLPNDHDEFVKTLQDFFGPEADAIAEYQGLVDTFDAEFMRLYELTAKGEPITEKDFPYLYEYGTYTGEQMLNKYFKNPMLKGVYQTLFGYLGMPVDRVPYAVLAALYLRNGGTWNVHETSMSMSNAITNEFIDCGGTLKLNTRVVRILVEDGAVKGVVTESGDVYYADVVLSNANRLNVYVDLIDNALVPEETYANLRVSMPGQSIFGISVGLDCTAEEVGIKNATNFLLPPPAGLKSRYDVGLRQLEKVSTVYMSCYSIDDPEYGEPGTCTLTMLTGKTTAPFVDMPPENYYDAKFEYAGKMLDYFEDYYPGVREHIEEIEVFTPMSLMRFIGSPNGAIYGVDGHIKDLIASKLDARSPFKGLYFCGASLMFGGFHTTLISGNTAAKLILKDLEEGALPVSHDFTGMHNIDRILQEIDVSRVYNVDHRANKGKIRRDTNLLHPDSIEFRVTQIREETSSTKTIRLAPAGGYVPPFIPGQFINLSVEVDGIRTSRPYSISSPCTERKHYEITVRRAKEGFVSDYLLDRLKEGDTLVSSGPAGFFYQFPCVHGKKLCFIAGGSGITPFMSMLESDADRLCGDKEATLIYGSAKEDDIVFAERLGALAGGGLKGFSLVPVISEPGPGCEERTGFITAELIKDVLGDTEGYTFFLCGPQEMYDFVLPELGKLGVPKRRIRTEVPSAPKHPALMPGWPEGVSEEQTFTITLDDGKRIPARAGDSILFSLEKAGLAKTNLCRGGECAVCRSRLMEGRVFHPGIAKMRKSDMRFGYIHPCVTYPVEDIRLLLL